MLTLGTKIKVLNTPSLVKVVDAAGAARATSAAIAGGDTLKVEGYGTFPINDIADIKCRRAVVATADDKEYTSVAPAGLAIGDAVQVEITIDTSRYQVDVLSANRINGGNTFIFSTLPLTAVTPTAITAAIVAGFVAYTGLFNIGTSLLNVIAGAAVTQFNVIADTLGSISIERVSLRRMVQGAGAFAAVSLGAPVATNSVAFEGLGIGKFLEESVHMMTGLNTDIYGLNTVDSVIDPRALYTNVSFSLAGFYEEDLSHTAADYGMTTSGVAKLSKFSIYLNESNSLAANDAINDLAAIAVLRAAALAALTSTVVAAPLTIAQETSEVLIIADSSSVATAAAFIV